MKLLSITSLAILSLTSTQVHGSPSCLTTVEDGVDYFPHKVIPEDSKFWDVEYANTYKIVTNKSANTTYLLYQCGSEPPADQLDGRHAEVFEIPLSGVGITQTPTITYLEQLGLLEEITVFLSDPDTISSPCFKVCKHLMLFGLV
jgi:hypothetical protein